MAEAAGVLVALVWASNFIVVKAAIDVLPPVVFATTRFALAALLLLVILQAVEGTIRMPARDLATVGLLGAVGFGLYQVMWTTGLQSIGAGDSALLIAATPVLTALVAVVAGSDTLTPRKLAGALVSFAGVAIVVAGGQGLSLGASVVGDLLTLGAALCWAIYISFGAPILQRHSPLRTTAWAMAAGALVMTPIAVGQLSGVDWSTVTPSIGGLVLYSAVVPAALATVVVFHGVKVLGPTRITAFQFLVPAFAVAFAALALAEPIRWTQLAGGAVIVAGILLTRSGGGWRRAARFGRAPA